MQLPSDKAIEHLLQEHVLILFRLPEGNLIWQGSSELNTQSFVYYFCINSDNYLLVNESYHGVGDSTLVKSIIGNAVAPHQKVVRILPKEGTRTYVNISSMYSKSIPRLTGDFSVFQILD